MFRFLQQTLYCSSGTPETNQSISGGIIQLSRIQSVDLDISYNRSSQSYLNENVENILIERPFVNLSFEYLTNATRNERAVGFQVDGWHSAFWLLNNEKNFYISNENDVVDANLSSSSTKSVIGIGNALINGYSVSASVGDIFKSTITAQGLNAVSYTGNSGQLNPAINPITATQLSNLFSLTQASPLISTSSLNSANDLIAIGAKDLVMQFPSGSVFATVMTGTNGCLLQNFNLAFSIDRNDAKPLGAAYPTNRRITYPIHVTLSADAILNTYALDALTRVNCADSGYDLNIILMQPCTTSPAVEYRLRGLKLQSQHIKSAINDFTTVSFNWEAMVGNLNDSGNNVFIKGYDGTDYYTMDSVSYITGMNVDGDYSLIEQVAFTRNIVEQQFFSGLIK